MYSSLCNGLEETAGRSPKEQVLLVLLLGFAECGNRKALRLRAQGVYFCKRPSLNVENNAASAAQCNGLEEYNQRGYVTYKNREPKHKPFAAPIDANSLLCILQAKVAFMLSYIRLIDFLAKVIVRASETAI